MRNLICCMFVLLISGVVFAQTHNPVVGEEGTMTAKVITPLTVFEPSELMEYVVIQNQTKTLTADNKFEFRLEGEAGMFVNVNFIGPNAVVQPPIGSIPVLSGAWFGPGNVPVTGNSGTYQIPDFPAESFFDVFFELNTINATGADLGIVTYELGIEYSYQGM